MNAVPTALAITLVAAALPQRPSVAAERPVAVFDFEPIDTSLDGVHE